MFTQIFSNNEFELPIHKYEGDYYEFLSKIFDEYCEKVRFEYVDSGKLTAKEMKLIENICSSILLALRNQYSGLQDRAYINVKKALDIAKDYLIYRRILPESELVLYRVRKGNNHEYTTSNMFHVPFQLRHVVQSYRYSIPGHPSLYLGSSPYVCWNELRRPNFDELQISSFEMKNTETLRVLDFGYRPIDIFMYEHQLINLNPNDINYESDFMKLREYNTDLFKKYLFVWPILTSCSIKVKNDGSVFKPEYIIPQLLFQWLRKEKEIDGIRYFSVSTPYKFYGNFDVNPVDLIHNYVFPTKSFKFDGLCDFLKANFRVSKPVVWGMCDTFSSTSFMTRNMRFERIEIMQDFAVQYSTTKFSTIENILYNKQHIDL